MFRQGRALIIFEGRSLECGIRPIERKTDDKQTARSQTRTSKARHVDKRQLIQELEQLAPELDELRWGQTSDLAFWRERATTVFREALSDANDALMMRFANLQWQSQPSRVRSVDMPVS